MRGHTSREGSTWQRRNTTKRSISFNLISKTIQKSYLGHHFLGLAYLANRDVQQAKSELTEALKLNPDWMEARVLLADLHLRTGAPDLAIEEAQKVLEKDPKSSQAQLILVNAYFQKRDGQKANKAVDDLIQVAPNNPVAYYQKGRVLLAQRKEKEALSQFEKALSLQPNYVEALSLIVAVHLQQKENKRAIERVEAQIKVSPQNPFFYAMLGNLSNRIRTWQRLRPITKRRSRSIPIFQVFTVSSGISTSGRI